jgi:hypothetical protein
MLWSRSELAVTARLLAAMQSASTVGCSQSITRAQVGRLTIQLPGLHADLHRRGYSRSDSSVQRS